MEGVLIAARTLHFAAAIALTGVFAFDCLVASPALRLSGVAAASEAGLRRRLGWLAWASLALAIGSGTAWLVAVAANMSGKPVGISLCRDVLPVVLTRTRFGEDWLLRLALCVLLALCLAGRPFPRLRVSRVATWAGFLLGALVLATLAWAGHGAADPGASGNAHLVADILHLLAAGVWLGV